MRVLWAMSEGAFFVSQDKTDPRDIHFKLASETVTIPAEQHALRDDVEQTLIVLRGVYPESTPTFSIYFRQLLSLAQTGLVGKNAQPELAKRALANLRRDVTLREAGRIKNAYMRVLGLRALLLGVPALVAAYAFHLFSTGHPIEAVFSTVWGGCMGGCWVSFGARKPTISFEDLQVLEQDRVEPLMRLVFAGLLAETVALLIVTNAIDLKLGVLSASLLDKSYKVALLVGVLCGLAEQALPSKLLKRATDLAA
jgi:hypothetical protein